MMDTPEQIGRRLKALRYSLGYGHRKQSAFSDSIGLTKSTYSPFETGDRILTFEAAVAIRRRWGVSLDWLFYGEMTPAGHDLMLKLGPDPQVPDDGRLAKGGPVERPAGRAGKRSSVA
jgi:transcriptional regulator with XRE-family HTH domain